MDIREDFKEIVIEIQENGKEFKISTRDFLGYFHCEKRTKGNKARIDNFLDENRLETFPDYTKLGLTVKLLYDIKRKRKVNQILTQFNELVFYLLQINHL